MNTVNYLYKDLTLLSAADRVRRTADREEPNFAQIRLVRDLVQSYFHYTTDLISVVFFYRNGGTFSTNPGIMYEEKTLRNSVWYNKTLAEEGKIKLFGVQPNYLSNVREKYLNTAAIAIPEAMREHTGVEVIYFIYRGTLFQHLFDLTSKEHGAFIILDTENRVIAANRDTYIQNWPDQPHYLYKTSLSDSGEYTESIDGNKTFITFFTAPETRFKVIHMIPYSVLTAPLKKVFLFTILIVASVILLFLIASWFFAGTITKPIKDLVREMINVRKGTLQFEFQPAGPSEVFLLGTRFNAMLREMNQLIKEKEEQERAKSMAELRALQSQINPHFLLNTLNAIKLMAVISKVPNIRDMTDAFIRLLSSTFNRGGPLHRVKDEIEYLKCYFYIMNFRYGNYEVYWDIDRLLEEKYMLKLLIQPIVENAIVHGLQHKEGPGVLRVTGTLQDGRLLFIVEDNGIGMNPEEIGELLAVGEHLSFSKMGIRNVHQRIRLHYGESFGLEIFSREGEGTRVVVRLPVIDEITDEEGRSE
ncbi:sensor histidine kinase [Paenibacillus cisolokensis]|uniref:cache domain-containing sensor histidine kinase n=1 Tax=Paenibacillus cisolokensis TaxID=1658519 RepID=UPI003D280677